MATQNQPVFKFTILKIKIGGCDLNKERSKITPNFVLKDKLFLC